MFGILCIINSPIIWSNRLFIYSINFILSCGLLPVPYGVIQSHSDIPTAVKDLSFPAILKNGEAKVIVQKEESNIQIEENLEEQQTSEQTDEVAVEEKPQTNEQPSEPESSDQE